MIQILEASFLTSSASLADSPPKNQSEVAFLGRSNVGKSTIINKLLLKKGLAKSSSTPGKTKLINYFDVKVKMDEDKFPIRFVDLPGFGYAKVSKSTRTWWDQSLGDFLESRDSVKLFVHLIDSRHPEMESDLAIREFLESFLRGDQRVLEVYTKSDKLNQKEMGALRRKTGDPFTVSSLNNRNIDQLRERVVNSVLGRDND